MCEGATLLNDPYAALEKLVCFVLHMLSHTVQYTSWTLIYESYYVVHYQLTLTFSLGKIHTKMRLSSGKVNVQSLFLFGGTINRTVVLIAEE